MTPPASGSVSSASPPGRRAAAPVPPPDTRGSPLPGASAPSIDGAALDTPGSRSSGGALPRRPADTTADKPCTVAAVSSRLSCRRVCANSPRSSAARQAALTDGIRLARPGRPHPQRKRTTTVPAGAHRVGSTAPPPSNDGQQPLLDPIPAHQWIRPTPPPKICRGYFHSISLTYSPTQSRGLVRAP